MCQSQNIFNQWGQNYANLQIYQQKIKQNNFSRSGDSSLFLQDFDKFPTELLENVPAGNMGASKLMRSSRGYRNMIRFSAGGLFEHPVFVEHAIDYLMWLDSDAYFPGKLHIDILHDMYCP